MIRRGITDTVTIIHFNSGDVAKCKEILGVMTPNIDVLLPPPFENGANSGSPMSDKSNAREVGGYKLLIIHVISYYIST